MLQVIFTLRLRTKSPVAAGEPSLSRSSQKKECFLTFSQHCHSRTVATTVAANMNMRYRMGPPFHGPLRTLAPALLDRDARNTSAKNPCFTWQFSLQKKERCQTYSQHRHNGRTPDTFDHLALLDRDARSWRGLSSFVCAACGRGPFCGCASATSRCSTCYWHSWTSKPNEYNGDCYKEMLQ